MTEGQDELIWGGLGNLRFLQVNIRLVNLKRNIVILAGEKTQTGQTAPKKDPVLSKLD